MKKILVAILALVIAVSGVFTLVACQDKNTEDKDLVVVTNCPFEPFEYLGEDGKIYGIDMEIIAGFASKIGKNLKIKNLTDFDTIFTQLSAGYADIGTAGITVSEDREAIYDFSTKYYNASQMLLVKIDNTLFDTCRTADEVEAIISGLTDTSFGYQTGTTGGMYVIGDEDWGYDGFDNLTGVGYDSAATAIPKLIDGTLTAIVVDNAPASALAAANSTDIKLINVPLTEEEYAFCLPKGSEYKTALDEYFAEIKQNGTLQAIIDKYFGGEGTKVGYGVVTE